MTADTVDKAPEQLSRPYETDYYGWLEDQVALLKAGRLSDIDSQNIAEEIKDIGTRQYDMLENAARALIYNLLKWDLQPDRRSKSMVFSIEAHRDQITRLLDRNPSLASRVPEALANAYLYATYDMMRDSDLPQSVFASSCPYDWDTLREHPIEFQGVESPTGSEHP
ncbi:MAG TPA: DUF29 domain-containing protein [Rhodopseudomonas sp.]|uniref:DUF29 domain-containing protein n=1 Tax=Rhodopseudomonas sp. TaxID=1078 RepID=UPI002ED8CFA8